MLTSLTLASLLAGAAAVPQLEHRALAEQSPGQVISGALAFAADVRAATTTDANGNNALYFHAIKTAIPQRDEPEKCGDVNAAPYMPAAMFEPRNFVALTAYVTVTLDLYVNPNSRGSPLALGRCNSLGYTTDLQDEVDGVSWFGAGTAAGPSSTTLMIDTCASRCQCAWRGNECPAGFTCSDPKRNLPACTDEVDDPSADRWCSLCGPTTACEGCENNQGVEIRMWKKPAGLPNIVAIATSVPSLSTLVTAVQAADLVDTLSGEGPFTVFAPTNDAFAEVQDVVNELLLPANQNLLAKVLKFHVLASEVLKAAIMNGQSVATVEGQDICFETIQHTGGSSAAWRAGFDVNVFPCGSTATKSRVTTADVMASNGVVHVINQVLVPSGIIGCPGLACNEGGVALFTCQAGSGDCVEVKGGSGGIPRAQCEQICIGPTPELWFRAVASVGFTGSLRCGEVDAAPRMPVALFQSANAAQKQQYIDVTIAEYNTNGDGSAFLELGRCADVGYTTPAGSGQTRWDPSSVMRATCQTICQCNYGLNQCFGLEDGQATAGSFCSLCDTGSAFNSLATIDFYIKPNAGGH